MTEVRSRKAYHARYYKDHASEISEKRKDKYRTDPEYKKQVLERNRQYVPFRQKDADGIKVWNESYRDTEIKGVQYSTIGALAQALGCSEITIRDWEDRGVIPKCEMRSPRGDRLYSRAEVEKLADLLVREGRIRLVEEAKTGVSYFEVVKSGRPFPPIVAQIRNVKGTRSTQTLFRVSVLAARLGYAVSTISTWELKGCIPPTPFRKPFKNQDRSGVRLYTDSMIHACVEVFSMYDAPSEEVWPEIYEKIEKAWRQLGLFGGRATLES